MKKRGAVVRVGWVLACATLWAVTPVRAQEPTGTIAGSVTDTTGAIIPNAAVTITNKATGGVRSASSNAAGLYSAPSLLPGDYEVRLERTGFRTEVAAVQ